MVSFQIHSHKEPGLRIETEYAWSPPAGRAFFSKVLQPSVINQFPDYLGGGRDAAVQFTGEICDAEIARVHAQFQNLLLDYGILVREVLAEIFDHPLYFPFVQYSSISSKVLPVVSGTSLHIMRR